MRRQRQAVWRGVLLRPEKPRAFPTTQRRSSARPPTRPLPAGLHAALQAGWGALRPVLEPWAAVATPAVEALQRAAQPGLQQLLGAADARLAAYRPWQVAAFAVLATLLAVRLLRGCRRLARSWRDKGTGGAGRQGGTTRARPAVYIVWYVSAAQGPEV